MSPFIADRCCQSGRTDDIGEKHRSKDAFDFYDGAVAREELGDLSHHLRVRSRVRARKLDECRPVNVIADVPTMGERNEPVARSVFGIACAT